MIDVTEEFKTLSAAWRDYIQELETEVETLKAKVPSAWWVRFEGAALLVIGILIGRGVH